MIVPVLESINLDFMELSPFDPAPKLATKPAAKPPQRNPRRAPELCKSTLEPTRQQKERAMSIR
ncbi:hypothetical protein, partial [Pseudomonas sp. FW306-2-2C-D06C]|uniref:hypothetical protein n=1 Tax=Pseudomonas sp. FW306-2-2C-D06C TaxID=2070631 RepID=UPI001C45BD67